MAASSAATISRRLIRRSYTLETPTAAPGGAAVDLSLAVRWWTSLGGSLATAPSGYLSNEGLAPDGPLRPASADSIGRPGSLAQPELRGTGRPRSPALSAQRALRDDHLLLHRRLVGVRREAVDV